MKECLPRTKFVLFSLAAGVIGILGTMVLAEAFLRLGAGIQPWQNRPIAGEPVIHEPDALLGWKNQPGEYVFTQTANRQNSVTMHFDSDGSRVTSLLQHPREHRMIMLGCSLTQGWTISDSETYAWKLQAQFPHMEVCNYGTGGYGTYQSLLLLERLLSKSGPAPSLVIYGFASFHEDRNVAGWYWLKLLSSYSRRGHTAVPHCDLDPASGRLRRHSPKAYSVWPLKRLLATVVLAEEAFARLESRQRISQRRGVTEQLLIEMSGLCRKKGVRFLVAVLVQEPGSGDYRAFLQQNEIPYADCLHPQYGTPEFTDARDGHPNELMNEFWASRIGLAIASLQLRDGS